MQTQIFLLAFSLAIVTVNSEPILRRVIRGASDCKYEKEGWQDCDAVTGFQKRSLKLKPDPSNSPSCEPVKHMTRPCKDKDGVTEEPKTPSANCRYTKGDWSGCHEGLRNRTDVLREPTANCLPQKVVTKKCKTGVCRYAKADWSACENDVKKKVMNLSPGSSSECEKTRTLTKQCSGSSGSSKKSRRGSKKTNKE